MTVTIGILGFAHGHIHGYCQRWRNAPEATLVAGWDHDGDRLRDAAAKHGIAAEASAAALLARADVQAVVIASETAYHADLVEQAAAAGKAIVLQKPMALTLDQADRIVAAVEQYKVAFTVAWQMRVDAQNAAMKALVESGELGRIFMVRRRHGLFTHVWGDWFTESWHVKPELNRGMWADDASHAIDFLLWMFGRPISVSAEIATLHKPKVPDDNGIAVFRYADGMFAEVASSFTCLAGENTTEIVGERGVVIQNYGDLPSAAAPRPEHGVGLKWFLRGQEQWTVSDIPSPTDHGERIAGLAQPLLDFLLGRRPPLATTRDGRDALRMTLACYDAAEAGRRVALEFDQDA